MTAHVDDQSKILTSIAAQCAYGSHFVMHVDLCLRALVGIQAYSFSLQSVFAKPAVFILEITLDVLNTVYKSLNLRVCCKNYSNQKGLCLSTLSVCL